MSPAMSWAEHLVMVAAISVSLAVMIAVVFLAEHQSDSRRSHTGGVHVHGSGVWGCCSVVTGSPSLRVSA